MPRPIYETPRDREIQKNIMRPYARLFGYDFEELPELNKADFKLLEEGKHVANVEVKRRYIKLFQYSDIFLSEDKALELLLDPKPALFLVGFNDAMGWVQLRYEHLKTVRMSGRTRNRRDHKDVERCCHLPVLDFTAYFVHTGGWHRSRTPFQRDELRL